MGGSTGPSVGMSEYAADSCRGEPCRFGDRADGVAVRERSSDGCVPHASRLFQMFGELGELCGVQGDIAERIGDHTVRIIQSHLN